LPKTSIVARSIFFYTDSRALGGAERALLLLIENLSPAWRPTLLLDADRGAEPTAERAAALGVPIHRVAPMPLGLRGGRRAVGLARLLRHQRPDVFHAHLSWPLACKWALAAAVVARVPSVATVHLIPEFRLDRSSFWQLRVLARHVSRQIAVSRAIKAELVERFRWPEAGIEVIYNAVDVDRFVAGSEPELRRQLTGGRDLEVVLTAARLDPQKGHPVLLRAAKEVPDAVFALAGEGPERARLEALAMDLEVADRVLFLGRRTDIPELLAACDVFALPSLYEGSSLAVLEAMAARRPVVSSAIGGTDELIADGDNGLLVAAGDSTGLAAALRSLLADAKLREELAGRARLRVERDFTPSAMGRRVELIYEELLADGRRPA
jgi:glycosyltransferase involved in cell wall biosynthesis